MPEGVVPGEALKFATTLPLSGFGRGVIVTSIDGRPIKVEGNPRHPASLGATDVFAEASVLSLYDPDRSRTVLNNGAITSYDGFRSKLQPLLAKLRERDGEGFRLLTGRVTSPTMLRQIDDLLHLFPKAMWHAYEPVDHDAERAGAALAYGRPLETIPRLDKMSVLLTLDADPLGHGPDQLRNARGFAARRMPSAEGFSRIYSVEAAPTLTGAKADHRIALQPLLISEFAIAVARSMGAQIRDPVLPDSALRFAKQVAADLTANQGHGLVLAGRALSPEMNALVHWINARLQAPADLIDPVSRTPGGREAGTLPDLARSIDSGAVNMLVMMGVNPAYDAPADEFAQHADKVAFRLHVGRYADETAALSNWHIPQTHELEAWSDLRSVDGTASIVQPLIRPLYRTSTDHEVLALIGGRDGASPYDLVRETWQQKAGTDFEAWWTRALHDGVIAGSAAAVELAAPALPNIPAAATPANEQLTVVLRPDPCVWDGAFANNAWLQECPKPLTKQVWGNALALNPLRRFATAILATEPSATGPAISYYESGETVTRAFIEAGILALVSIAVLLFIALRRMTDVLLTLIPLLLAGAVTLEVCVMTGLALNFANIIALPLLLGVGVAFKIYYTMAWRAGKTGLLQSTLTRAVIFSAMTNAIAFGSMAVSSYPGMASMGKLVALALFCTLISAVLFQPVLMGRPRQQDSSLPRQDLLPATAE